ncbi:MAG: sugar phosphate isomerase/epimerase [Isosphaeraceae bacterium]|nr:sugar phosphate isomerase/epimerase [Isosphaeraceae bacterium]
MQGRLGPPTSGRFQCFPRESWSEEFERASRAGLDSIEWIYDVYGAGVNPLDTETGLREMRALASLHAVEVKSLCADYFMDRPFLRSGDADWAELLQTMYWLIGRCGAAEIGHIVLPFVDGSRIETAEEIDQVEGILRSCLTVAEAANVEIHLETSLTPGRFAGLLDRLPHPKLKANYDSGNSASLGYAPEDEFAAYGTRVGSIHIKDRLLNGGTVPLGTGDTDFPALSTAIRRVEYRGDFTLQVARGEAGDEIAWAIANREFVETMLQPSRESSVEAGR